MSKGKHIIIDIGHARGTGARGNGMEEHARCEQIAGHLANRLRADGYAVTVLDYPDSTNSADLVATVKAANGISRAAFGISLHMDAASKVVGYVESIDEDGEPCKQPIIGEDPAPHGAHVCYVSNTGKRMAEAIAKWLCTLLPGRASKTVKRGDLYILKQTRAPWVLVECGFITNPEDAATEPYQIAECIAAGVRHYFEEVAA